MAQQADIECIMNLVKTAGNEFLASDAIKSRYNGNGAKKALTVCDSLALNVKMMAEVIKQVLEKQATDKADHREELEKRDETIKELRAENNELKYSIDCASQYTRRENLKITGIPFVEGEDLKEIVKDLYKHTTDKALDDKDISVVHRINTKYDQESNTDTTQSGRPAKIPSIIVRYTVRDIKTTQMQAKKQIKSKPGYKYQNASIYEDVTPTRSRMMFELRNKKTSDNERMYQYVWSRDGKIFVRTKEEAERSPMPRPRALQRPEDLKPFGWTDQEIKNIIENKRV